MCNILVNVKCIISIQRFVYVYVCTCILLTNCNTVMFVFSVGVDSSVHCHRTVGSGPWSWCGYWNISLCDHHKNSPVSTTYPRIITTLLCVSVSTFLSFIRAPPTYDEREKGALPRFFVTGAN